MSRKADEDLSRLVYSTLDTFGFQRESVSFRSKVYEYFSNVVTQKTQTDSEGIPFSVVYVGSTGEGVALTDSDVDVMKILSDTVCVDKASAQSQFNILEAHYANASPGYAKIVAVHLDKSSNRNFLFSKSSSMYATQRGYPYIASDAFRNVTHKILTTYSVRFCEGFKYENYSNSGPATTSTSNIVADSDTVHSLYYFGKEHLSKWKARTRFNTWPSVNLIHEISQMEGYIVPVGDKLSDSQFLEWRICFTTAEKKLISTLNNVQIKLYVLLKLIGKKLLKPVCKEITSYVMKNVVFWVCETEPAKSFAPELLLKLVQKSLIFLKHCLENNHFPNYMIPDRNLLSVVSGHYKVRIQRVLSECLKDEGAIVLRIPKLHELMYCNFTPLVRAVYSEWRNEAEKVLITAMMRFYEQVLEFTWTGTSIRETLWKILKDKRSMELYFKCMRMFLPDMFRLLLKGTTPYEYKELFFQRCKAVWPL